MRLSAQAAVSMALRMLIVCALFYGSTRTFVDPDLFYHLKTGIDINLCGSITAPDTYSFLSFQQKWMKHEWLSETIFAFIYLHCGWAGLVAFKAAIELTILAIVYKILSRWHTDDIALAAFLLTTATFLAPATNTIRPHLFSCLFLAVQLVLLKEAGAGRPRFLGFLPLLFVLWVNLHGGFVVGLAALFIWTVAETAKRRCSGQGQYILFCWAILLVSYLATMVNPYGFELPRYLLQVSVMPRPDIFEWKPIELLSDLGFLWAAVTVLTLIAATVSKEPRDSSCLLLWLAFAAAPLVSIRHVQFFGFATVILAGQHLNYLWKLRPSNTSSPPPTRWGAVPVIFLAVSLPLSIWLVVNGCRFFTDIKLMPRQDLPIEAVTLLEKVGAEGNMVVDFDWGGYCIWHLAPAVKVSFDGRREFVYSPAATLANTVFTSGLDWWDFLLEKFPVKIVLAKKQSPSYNLMRLKSGWELDYEDDKCGLFFPTGSEQGKRAREFVKSVPPDQLGKLLTEPLLSAAPTDTATRKQIRSRMEK